MSELTPFNPSPETTDALIDDLGSPDLTLRDVAGTYKTTLEALTLWMTRADIATRINNIESAVARRTRLIATNFLPSTVQLLNQILNNQHEEEREPSTSAERRRTRDSARKAATLLYRLARFTPGAAPAPPGSPGGPRRSSAPAMPSSPSPHLESLAPQPIVPPSLASHTPPTPPTPSPFIANEPTPFSLLAQASLSLPLRPFPSALAPSDPLSRFLFDPHWPPKSARAP